MIRNTKGQFIKGHKVLKQWIQKTKLVNIGSKHSIEHRNKIGQANLGLKRSEEFKAKMSMIQKGVRNSNWQGGRKATRKAAESKRKALKLNGGSFTGLEWLKLKRKYKNTCPCCKRKEPEINLTVDHIVPLSKGGSNNIENIQPLCFTCNTKKRTKTIKYKIKL